MIVPLEHAPTEGLPMAWARALRIKESGNTVAHQPIKGRSAKANGRTQQLIVKRPGGLVTSVGDQRSWRSATRCKRRNAVVTRHTPAPRVTWTGTRDE